MGEGKYVNEDISIYSQDNLKTISDCIHNDNKESLSNLAKSDDEEYFKKFAKYLNDNIITNEKNKKIIEVKAKDVNTIKNDNKAEIIEVREKFFKNKFLPFLKNPKTALKDNALFELKDIDDLENKEDDWKSCFQDAGKNNVYREQWVDASVDEVKEINKYNKNNKKNNNNNDRYHDDSSEYPNSERDRRQYARDEIAIFRKIYTEKNSNYDKIESILEDNEDYSSVDFLSEFNKKFKQNRFNPLEEKSNLKKFLDVNVDRLCSVMEYLVNSLGDEPSLEELNEKKEEEGEEDEEKNEGKKDNNKKIVKSKMKNLKLTTLQYMFDAAKMDLDFCHSKIVRYNPDFIKEKEEQIRQNNETNEYEDEEIDAESENQESDNEDEIEQNDGILGKISGATNKAGNFLDKGQKMLVGLSKNAVNSGFISGFTDGDAYANSKNDVYKDHCNFLVNMISSLEEQLQKIGDFEDDTEKEKKEKDEEDSKENEENEEANANKQKFYDPYWYINELNKSDDSQENYKAEKLKNYYSERARLAIMYEFINDENNLNKILEKLDKFIYSQLEFTKTNFLDEDDKKSVDNLFRDKYEKGGDSKEIETKLNKIKDKYVFQAKNEFLEYKIKIEDSMLTYEKEIKKQMEIGRNKCERNYKEQNKEKLKIFELLTTSKEFENSDNKNKFEQMLTPPDFEYFNATGNEVVEFCDINHYYENYREIFSELIEGDSNNKIWESIISLPEFKKLNSKLIRIENKFPQKIDKIDKDLKKYFYDNSDLFNKIFVSKVDREQAEENKKKEEEKKKKEEEEEKKKKEEKEKEEKENKEKEKKFGIYLTEETIYNNSDEEIKKIRSKFKKVKDFKSLEERKKEAEKKVAEAEKEAERIKSQTVEEAERKNTIEKFLEYFSIKSNDEFTEEKVSEELKREHSNLDDNKCKEIYNLLLNKYKKLKKQKEDELEEAKKRSTPKGFLKYLNVESIEELKKQYIDDKKNDKDASHWEDAFNALKKRYDELVQKVIDDEIKAMQKVYEGFGPPKKTIRDILGSNKDNWQIGYIFKMPEKNWISYKKYIDLSADDNPSAYRYLQFLCFKNIKDLDTAYESLKNEEDLKNDNNEYHKALDYYKTQYKEAAKSIFNEQQNKDDNPAPLIDNSFSIFDKKNFEYDNNIEVQSELQKSENQNFSSSNMIDKPSQAITEDLPTPMHAGQREERKDENKVIKLNNKSDFYNVDANKGNGLVRNQRIKNYRARNKKNKK